MFEMCCSNKQSTEVATRDNSSGLQKKSILKKEKKKKKGKKYSHEGQVFGLVPKYDQFFLLDKDLWCDSL